MTKDDEMTPIVTIMANVLLPIILIFSFYVILHGHLTPGGGFQGGAIGASAIIMLIISYGAKEVYSRIKTEDLSVFDSMGGVIFVVVGLIGFFASATFMYNFLVGEPLFGNIPPFGGNLGELNSGGFLPLFNIAVGMKVIGGLASVVLVLALPSDSKGDTE